MKAKALLKLQQLLTKEENLHQFTPKEIEFINSKILEMADKK